jgi:UDP-N-acetylmuramoyl-tripeptide--D-alanyl-D-alanine ligase
VGSIGKTSTKRAIAELLSAKHRVQYQAGNYNDLATVPLVFFGQPTPSLFNPLAWLKVFISNERQLTQSYPYDVVVLELGTDGPGQIASFGRYVHLDIAVITALTPEHMEYFEDVDAVAAEELSVASFADKIVMNVDFADPQYVEISGQPVTYGIKHEAFYMAKTAVEGKVTTVTITKDSQVYSTERVNAFSLIQIYSLLAATIVWDLLGNPAADLAAGLANITDNPGRMQLLEGARDVTIIDDSYNASPEAMIAALDTLYDMPGQHKVALLGNMNELGTFGVEAHQEIGEYCDPNKLEEVLTLGPEANKYLAPAAEAKGCKVTTFDSPYKAGEYLRSHLPEGAVVLVKGSQNRVFAEEAIKSILVNPADNVKLVRQSKDWLAIKKRQFDA